MECAGFIWAGIYVEDMVRAIRFYRDTLGLPLLARGEGWARFDASNGALLELSSGGIPRLDPKGPDEQSVEVGFRVPDLGAAIEELSSQGVSFTSGIEESGDARWIHFVDPEGNRLAIKQI